MSTRVGDWLGMVVLFAALLAGQRVMTSSVERGTSVYLGHVCSKAELSLQGDGRPVLVRYAPAGESRINQSLFPVETDIRNKLKEVMATRQERALFFSADERLSYGEVTQLISAIDNDNSDMAIFLLTRSQMSSANIDHSTAGIPFCIPQL